MPGGDEFPQSDAHAIRKENTEERELGELGYHVIAMREGLCVKEMKPSTPSPLINPTTKNSTASDSMLRLAKPESRTAMIRVMPKCRLQPWLQSFMSLHVYTGHLVLPNADLARSPCHRFGQ